MARQRRDQSLPPHVLAAKRYRLMPDAKNLSRAATERAKRWPTIAKFDGHPDGIAEAHLESKVTKRHLHMLERKGQLSFDTSPNGVVLRGIRLSAIPRNYRGTVPERVQMFLEKLVNKHGFVTACRNDESKTIRILRGETDFGYFNATVDAKGGVIGYHFDFPPFRAGAKGADRAPPDFDLDRFCKYFRCCSDDFELDRRTGGQKKGFVYLLIKHAAAAERILLHNAGIDLKLAPIKLAADQADQYESGGFYDPQDGDQRPIVERQIRERRGQQQFRDALRKRYGDRCLVTGCQVLDVLEAAHIKQYRGGKDNNEQNGLLLRADIHTLFDLGLLAIEPSQLRIELHPAIQKDGDYASLHGKRLSCTTGRRPSVEALEIRYGEFQAGLKQARVPRRPLNREEEPVIAGAP